MGIKKFRPTTPSRRHMATPDYSEITKAKPERSLVVSLSEKAGRNKTGRITMRSRGGRGRIKYRIIDFKRDKLGVPGKVVSIEYDPNRSARIALISYLDGENVILSLPSALLSVTALSPARTPTSVPEMRSNSETSPSVR